MGNQNSFFSVSCAEEREKEKKPPSVPKIKIQVNQNPDGTYKLKIEARDRQTNCEIKLDVAEMILPLKKQKLSDVLNSQTTLTLNDREPQVIDGKPYIKDFQKARIRDFSVPYRDKTPQKQAYEIFTNSNKRSVSHSRKPKSPQQNIDLKQIKLKGNSQSGKKSDNDPDVQLSLDDKFITTFQASSGEDTKKLLSTSSAEFAREEQTIDVFNEPIHVQYSPRSPDGFNRNYASLQPDRKSPIFLEDLKGVQTRNLVAQQQTERRAPVPDEDFINDEQRQIKFFRTVPQTPSGQINFDKEHLESEFSSSVLSETDSRIKNLVFENRYNIKEFDSETYTTGVSSATSPNRKREQELLQQILTFNPQIMTRNQSEKELDFNPQFTKKQSMKLQNGDEYDRKVSDVLGTFARQNTQLLQQEYLNSNIKDFVQRFDLKTLQKMKLKDLETYLTTLVPVLKISQGKFLIGTKLKQLEIQQNMIMLRVGGGYQKLAEFILQNAPFLCLTLYQMMADGHCHMSQIIEALLHKHQVDQVVINDFLKVFTMNEEKIFKNTMQAYKEKLQKRADRKTKNVKTYGDSKVVQTARHSLTQSKKI